MDALESTFRERFRAALVAAGVHRKLYALRRSRPELGLELDEILTAIEVATESLAGSYAPTKPHLSLVSDAAAK